MRLVWLSVGMFAIGTEAFMIAGLLPVISADLGVTVSGAGQLVSVFALVYAVSSPISATLTAGQDRRRVLLASLAGFLAANLLAAAAGSYGMLMAARVLLAMSAGLFSPSAASFAGTYAAPQQRGRALAFVVGGASAAVALGSPLGTLTGALLGWRFTFLAVAALSAVALVGIALRLPAQSTAAHATLAERVRIATGRDVGVLLLSTVFWATGQFAVYIYLAPLAQALGGWQGAALSVVLLAFGLGAVAGTTLGGVLADRLPLVRLQAGVLGGLLLLSASIAAAALTVSPSLAAALGVLALFAGWGLGGWMFHTVQQVRMMAAAPGAAPTVLSLHQSALYLGIALGGMAGGITLRLAPPPILSGISAMCQLTAAAVLALSIHWTRQATRQRAQDRPIPTVAMQRTGGP